MNRLQRRASISNGKSLIKQGWTAFEEISEIELRERNLLFQMKHVERIYRNSRYVVQVFHPIKSPWGGLTKVGIRRNDEAPVHSWAEIQRIKNEIFGLHREGIEVYPAQTNLVDQANMYWIWVLDSKDKVPFNFSGELR